MFHFLLYFMPEKTQYENFTVLVFVVFNCFSFIDVGMICVRTLETFKLCKVSICIPIWKKIVLPNNIHICIGINFPTRIVLVFGTISERE